MSDVFLVLVSRVVLDNGSLSRAVVCVFNINLNL